MAASTEVVIHPDAGLFDWERPQGVARFVEFALTLAPPYRQIDLKHENPLCRVAARTAAGAQTCGQGCGMDCAAPPASHVCPFGMMMVRAAQAAGAASARWVGRRFPDVESMHAGLDRLLAEGLDEDVILDCLPPNPVVSPEELREVAGAAKTPGGVVEAIPVQPAPAEPAEEARATGLLEYLEQVHRLLAEAPTPEALCERVLHAVAVMAPFDEMAIYLRGRGESPWELAALVKSAEDYAGVEQPEKCAIEPFAALIETGSPRRILAHRGGQVQPFDGDLKDGMTVALPLPLVGSDLVGVWLLHQEALAGPGALGPDLVQTLRLLSEFMATRLKHLLDLAGRGAAAPGAAASPVMDLVSALCAEASRASRQNQPFTLLCLQAFGRSPAVELPAADLTREFTAVLRPYDTLVADPHTANTWFAVLPSSGEEAARLVATRLITVFEDQMDACGGTEELGLRLGIGVSAWGADAAGPEEMILHAGSAAAQAQTAMHSSINFFAADPSGVEADAV